MNDTGLLRIRMETPNGSVVVRSQQAIVSLQGIFIRGILLPTGTRVLIRLSQGRNEVAVKGFAYADRSGDGVAVQWEGISNETSRKLVSILTAAA